MGTIDAAGAFVRQQSARRVLVLSILTFGLYGAFWHAWTNADLGRYGRARERMPFPYIEVSHAWSCVAYIFGWVAALALWAQGLTYLVDGRPEGLSDWMGIVSSAVLAAPLWGTARATMQRIKTARMLAGIAEPVTSAGLVGVLAVLMPPLYAWKAQRALTPAWARYGEPAVAPQPFAQPLLQPYTLPTPERAVAAAPAVTAHQVLGPADIAHEVRPADGLLVEDDQAAPHPAQSEPVMAPTQPPVSAHFYAHPALQPLPLPHPFPQPQPSSNPQPPLPGTHPHE
ncbi:MAG: hypothetical protein H7123_00050 [Thermoleophilia bacterium]|nr:hypothetical protein [Thermoleophilia bacterium]